VLIGLLAWWLWHGRQATARELAAKSALADLGALVVMDGSRKHVASLNLSTLSDAEKVDKALEHVPHLFHLSSFDASRTPIRDEQLKQVGTLSGLENLTLTSTSISDAGIAHLAGLKKLQSLHLTGTKVSSSGLNALTSLEGLRVLDLSATAVSGNLGQLSSLPQLDWLILRNVTLEDDALGELAGCQKLSRLSLEGSQYDQESLEKLRQSQLTIDVNQ
jgi:Leucine-rich repeat (LRR) protein